MQWRIQDFVLACLGSASAYNFYRNFDISVGLSLLGPLASATDSVGHFVMIRIYYNDNGIGYHSGIT